MARSWPVLDPTHRNPSGQREPSTYALRRLSGLQRRVMGKFRYVGTCLPCGQTLEIEVELDEEPKSEKGWARCEYHGPFRITRDRSTN